MTSITTTHAAPFGAITTFRAIHAVETAINSLIAWNAKRQTKKVLSTLTLRQLDDIGLASSEL